MSLPNQDHEGELQNAVAVSLERAATAWPKTMAIDGNLLADKDLWRSITKFQAQSSAPPAWLMPSPWSLAALLLKERSPHKLSCFMVVDHLCGLGPRHRLSSCVMIKPHCCSYSRSWRMVPLSCAQVRWGDNYLLAGRVRIPPALWCTSRLQAIAGSIQWGIFRTMNRRSSIQSPVNHLVPTDSLEVILRLSWPWERELHAEFTAPLQSYSLQCTADSLTESTGQ